MIPVEDANIPAYHRSVFESWNKLYIGWKGYIRATMLNPCSAIQLMTANFITVVEISAPRRWTFINNGAIEFPCKWRTPLLKCTKSSSDGSSGLGCGHLRRFGCFWKGGTL